ncbi:MAG TPA: tryptophan--tRNA ligase, partial [Thermoanaerobaculia bacterium]|nr:tryptophan--tRNA ligase [Thermoanaerobaculia bacterium]
MNQPSHVLSGLRPTGRIHLGNYFGAIRNWVDLQDRYTSYVFIADWHALTSDYADPSKVRQATFEAAADLLAAGIDPKRCTIFVQSEVKEHAELHLLLSMVTPLPWLER